MSNRPDEALLDSRAARTFGVEPGDTIGVRLPGRRVRLRVVGVVAATDTVTDPGGVVRLTPAFYRAHRSAPDFYFVVDVRLKRAAADLPSFRQNVDGLALGALVDYQPDRSGEAHGSIRNLAQALWLGIALGALLTLLLLIQSLARLAASAA